MTIIHTVSAWHAEEKKLQCLPVGLVPTMGALHKGHMSLVERSMRENDRTVVSIFLNPVQFNNKNDLDSYPKTWESDCRQLEQAGVDYLFAPDYGELYPDDYRYRISENSLSRTLCGVSRPGHFDGVLTVVMKLLQLFRPDRAYFGEKDYQQYLLIKGMAQAFFLQTAIIPCPIVRESSGLACSSRNSRLSGAGREKASAFYRILASGRPVAEIEAELVKEGFRVDYVRIVSGRIYGAVFLEEVRLIDNVTRS